MNDLQRSRLRVAKRRWAREDKERGYSVYRSKYGKSTRKNNSQLGELVALLFLMLSAFSLLLL